MFYLCLFSFQYWNAQTIAHRAESNATDSFLSWYTPSMVCVWITRVYCADVHVEHEIEKDKQIRRLHTTKHGPVARRESAPSTTLFFCSKRRFTHRHTYTRPLTWSSLIAIRRVSYKYVSNLFKWFFSVRLTDTISHTTKLLK